jgi:hypothetical protein
MTRRRDRVSLALGIVTAGFLLIALMLRPQPLPPGSAQYKTPLLVNRPAVPARTFAIDTLEANGQLYPAASPPPISTRGPIVVHGWAIDSRTSAPAQLLLMGIDGARATAVTTYGTARPDVAAIIAQSALNSGFAATIPAHHLRAGKHVLHFILVGVDGRRSTLPAAITFELESGTGK